MNARPRTIFLLLCGTAVFLLALAKVESDRVAAERGLQHLMETGFNVQLKRVDSGFNLIPRTVCWVEYQSWGPFDSAQLDDFIAALKGLGVKDYRIDMGEAQINGAQKQRLLEELPGKKWLKVRNDP